VRGAAITPRTRDLFGYAFFAAHVAALRLTRPLPILRQQPRHQDVRAEDDHQAFVITPLLANAVTKVKP